MLRHVTASIPNPPALDTAATKAGHEALPIGAWIIGNRTPKRSQSEVFNIENSPDG